MATDHRDVKFAVRQNLSLAILAASVDDALLRDRPRVRMYWSGLIRCAKTPEMLAVGREFVPVAAVPTDFPAGNVLRGYGPLPAKTRRYSISSQARRQRRFETDSLNAAS